MEADNVDIKSSLKDKNIREQVQIRTIIESSLKHASI